VIAVSHRVQHAAALGWFALVAACVFWGIVFAQQVLYWGDIMLYFLPMDHLRCTLADAGDTASVEPAHTLRTAVCG